MQLYQLTPHVAIIMNFWSKEKCKDFIAQIEARGYQNAKINIHTGYFSQIWKILKDFLFLFANCELRNEKT